MQKWTGGDIAIAKKKELFAGRNRGDYIARNTTLCLPIGAQRDGIRNTKVKTKICDGTKGGTDANLQGKQSRNESSKCSIKSHEESSDVLRLQSTFPLVLQEVLASTCCTAPSIFEALEE
mmetsp:Transcript_21801/g.33877  ORF Transcript_21801/g.33877 Transcript_21801/m.33877 type:complete len:120 (-) Transcript_21801:85-444(-)